jgi:hypothetical protein
MSVLAGDTLLHADLNPAHVLLGEGGAVYLVDWTFAGRGAAFVHDGGPCTGASHVSRPLAVSLGSGALVGGAWWTVRGGRGLRA